MCRRGTTSLVDMFLTERLHRIEDSSTWFWPFQAELPEEIHQPPTQSFSGRLGARYTFMTGVSCSSELCGRMALLFECSFSRFCKKPLLLRPSIMTVLLEARLTRVLLGGKKRGPWGWYLSTNMPFEQGDVFMHSICPPRGAQRVQCQKRSLFSLFDYNMMG